MLIVLRILSSIVELGTMNKNIEYFQQKMGYSANYFKLHVKQRKVQKSIDPYGRAMQRSVPYLHVGDS